MLLKLGINIKYFNANLKFNLKLASWTNEWRFTVALAIIANPIIQALLFASFILKKGIQHCVIINQDLLILNNNNYILLIRVPKSFLYKICPYVILQLFLPFNLYTICVFSAILELYTKQKN